VSPGWSAGGLIREALLGEGICVHLNRERQTGL